jgi:guanylate kinase
MIGMDRTMTSLQPAVILYGPPACGKDTITRALTYLNAQYVPFQRMKIGSGNANGYRLASPADLASLHTSGDVIYQNERYGNTYVVDRPHLAAILKAGQTPVLHLGQVAGIRAVTSYPARWITVLLWCSRETTAQRAQGRGSVDVDARLAAWDETAQDLKQAGQCDFNARLDTDTTPPREAAEAIAALVATTDQGAQPR